MSPAEWIVLAVLLVAIVLFISEKLSIDLVALLIVGVGMVIVGYARRILATYVEKGHISPLVAGLIGVMRSLDPSLTPWRAHQILHETGVTGPDASKVGRMIHAEAALRRLLRR